MCCVKNGACPPVDLIIYIIGGFYKLALSDFGVIFEVKL